MQHARHQVAEVDAGNASYQLHAPGGVNILVDSHANININKIQIRTSE